MKSSCRNHQKPLDPDIGNGLALQKALESGHYECLALLLEAGADKDALHNAVSKGNLEIMRALLQAGADIGAVDDRFGGTALHSAARMGRLEATRLLLAFGADKNARNSLGQTAAELAALKGRKKMLQLLQGEFYR